VQVNPYTCHKEGIPDYIAYKGEVYQIEFYFDGKGKCQSRDYILDKFSGADARKFEHLLMMIGDTGKIRNKEKFRNEGDKIYAFKPQPHRFLCFFFDRDKIIITNAFMKKQQKLPEGEKERAIKYKQNYEGRVKNGSYYERKK
jgi:hypothetical protein